MELKLCQAIWVKNIQNMLVNLLLVAKFSSSSFPHVFSHCLSLTSTRLNYTAAGRSSEFDCMDREKQDAQNVEQT